MSVTTKPCAQTTLVADNTPIPCDEFIATECVIHPDALVELGLPENSNVQDIINAFLLAIINLNNLVGGSTPTTTGVEVQDDGSIVVNEALKINFTNNLTATVDGVESDKVNVEAVLPTYTIGLDGSNILSLSQNGSIIDTVDLTPFLDNTNLPRVVGGAVVGTDMVFTRDDLSTFSVDVTNLVNTIAPAVVTSGAVVGTDIVLTKDDASTVVIDVTPLFDDTNQPRIVSGSLAGSTLTLTRDDASDFTVDLSGLLDDTNLPRITSGLLNGSNELVLNRDDASTIVVDLSALVGAGGGISSVVGGDGITVDATDPDNPIVNSSGLERITEVSSGWRLVGRDPADYGDIGADAVDLSVNSVASTTRGATGVTSFASGLATTSSGIGTTAMGGNTVASGDYAMAVNRLSIASGNRSFAAGEGMEAPSLGEFAIGYYGTQYTPTGGSTTFNNADRLFNVGNGINGASRSDALTIFKEGQVIAPSLTNTLIDGAAGTVLITKDWFNANVGGGGGISSVVAGTNVTVDNTDPANPIVNGDGTDLSYNDSVRVLSSSTGANVTLPIADDGVWGVAQSKFENPSITTFQSGLTFSTENIIVKGIQGVQPIVTAHGRISGINGTSSTSFALVIDLDVAFNPIFPTYAGVQAIGSVTLFGVTGNYKEPVVRVQGNNQLRIVAEDAASPGNFYNWANATFSNASIDFTITA